MKLSSLALVSCVLESAACLPVPRSTPSIPAAPSGPSEIVQWADDFLALFTTTLWATVGQKTVSELTPRYSLDWLAKFAAIGTAESDLPPNYNTDFDAVEGVTSAQVKWLVEANNRTKDDPVVFYLHGGGYSFGVLPAYATNLWNLYKELGNDRLSILWLDYTLTLDAPYPTQLRQAAAVYNELAKSSNNIVLEGDSAGGHLSLNMLRTLQYPVDTVESLTSLPSGLIMLSPAVMFGADPNNGTMAQYYGRDLIDAQALNQMGVMLSSGNAAEQASVFFNQWKDYIDWKPLLPDPSKIMTTYGEIEVLRGPIEEFLDIAFGGHASNTSGTTVVMETDGQHDGIFRGTVDPLWKPYVDFHTRF